MLFHQAVQNHLALVPEGRMPEVMRQGDGLGQVFIQHQRAGDVAGNGGDFHRVRQAGAEVIAGAV